MTWRKNSSCKKKGFWRNGVSCFPPMIGIYTGAVLIVALLRDSCWGSGLWIFLFLHIFISVSRARFSAKVPHGKHDIYQKVACFFMCGRTSMIRTPQAWLEPPTNILQRMFRICPTEVKHNSVVGLEDNWLTVLCSWYCHRWWFYLMLQVAYIHDRKLDAVTVSLCIYKVSKHHLLHWSKWLVLLLYTHLSHFSFCKRGGGCSFCKFGSFNLFFV